MRDLDWWGIGAQSLKIPFNQWPTLLACLASASVATAIVGIVFVGGTSLLPDETSTWLIDRAAPYVLASLAFLWFVIFQWCWMTALWHNTLRQCLTYFLQRDFWKFAALLLLLLIGDSLFWGAKIFSEDLVGTLLTGHGRAHSSSVIGFGLAAAGLHAGLFARFMIWPAYVVAQRALVGPAKIWRATDGLFWDFIFLGMRIQIPIAFVGFVLVVLSMLFLRSGSAVILISVPLSIFAVAATSAASLLAYFEVFGKRNPATLPAY